ncbi:RNA-binding RNA annealing protein [Cryptotrichosporon argae]
MDIDKPLDEIIAAKPRKGRGGGGRVRSSASRPAAAAGGAKAPATGARQRYAGAQPAAKGARAPAAAPQKALTADAIKIIISNLPSDVTEAAVRDLMQSTVGPVRSVQMSYTSTGKPTGTATVLFKNKGDANKAHSAYHNRMIDNR